jgi:hypothetical protein
MTTIDLAKLANVTGGAGGAPPLLARPKPPVARPAPRGAEVPDHKLFNALVDPYNHAGKLIEEHPELNVSQGTIDRVIHGR